MKIKPNICSIVKFPEFILHGFNNVVRAFFTFMPYDEVKTNKKENKQYEENI